MKIYSLIFLILITFENISGQNLPEFDHKKVTMHFTTIGNTVTVKLNNADPTKIVLKSTEGSLTKLSDTSYSVWYNYSMDEAKIKLYYKNLPIDVINVSVKNLPTPEVVINGKTGGSISKEEMLSVKNVNFALPDNMEVPLGLEIMSFNITVIMPGKDPQFFSTRQNAVPDNVLKIFNELKTGSSITFDQVRFKVGNYVLNLAPKPTMFTIN